jgi:hypothetical protein
VRSDFRSSFWPWQFSGRILKLTEFSGENRVESLTSAAGEAILHG